MKTDHTKGIPGYMGSLGDGPVKVTVTPKSGTEGLRECLVVMSMDGSASGRAMARDDTVGIASKDEPPIDSWEGRCGLWMGCVALPKPGFTGGVKSRDVVHFMDICGWQVLESLRHLDRLAGLDREM